MIEEGGETTPNSEAICAKSASCQELSSASAAGATGQGGEKCAYPQITLITKCDRPALMSKRISLDVNGKLRSDGSECRMMTGTAARAFTGTASALAQLIVSCGSNQAIALGRLRPDLPDSVDVTIPRRLDQHPGAITRSRAYIDYQHGTPAWCLIDFDSKAMPDEVKARIDAAGGMWNVLLTIAPAFVHAARVSRASTSAGLSRIDTGEPIAGSNGEHHFLLIADGGDAERFLKQLHERCWLHGLGWHMIGGGGQLLERSIVDRMVGFGERLCFEGAPVLTAPLKQDPARRLPRTTEGNAIDTRRVVPALNVYDQHRVKEAKAASARAMGKPAAEARNRHDKELAKKLSEKVGVPLVTAQRLVEARHRGVLFPDIELIFDHLDAANVGAVLADPDQYLGETLADPLEGVDYGRCKAKVMKDANNVLFIHSFAHGRSIYYLSHDLRSAKAAFARDGAGNVDSAMMILGQAELEEDELEEFVAFVSEATGVGKRALKGRIKKELAEGESKVRTASMEAETHETDGRIVMPRPEVNGELLPIVTFLDGLFANAPGEEPPMRNASKALVRVEEREPWALHLLTSDGANAVGEDMKAVRPPAEPILIELTPTGVELLLEKFIRWAARKKDKSIYFATLPRAFITALMEYPDSKIHLVRGINTSPLVTMSGQVIDGEGFDRSSGLMHRIDPVLRACLPADKPTDRDVKKALTFLLDEWLVDVALDRATKCVAVMLALTLIQRGLLPERPAFFVTAGQRGGGKTTLVAMIVTAVLGRRPAAAAWSDHAEERKKSLFSFLRQCVATLVWDNIARGSTISCPHIEAALTASEIADRVLGASEVEIVPATSVQIFTGNSIGPRGDMASRSFMLSLDVDRPDPENRNFKHADPLAWTEANRTKILSALYCILIAGALNRPQDQLAKTRFKTWWSLIGWPVEYAADLCGIKVDCTELMRIGENGEEEASAASRVLANLRKRWGDGGTFTTGDVVKELQKADSSFDSRADRAAELLDALGDLIGKPLERPTARSLGKLFQKHLTGRPAWIDDENCVAVLRKNAGSRANDYKVETSSVDKKPGAPVNSSASGRREEPANGTTTSGGPWKQTL